MYIIMTIMIIINNTGTPAVKAVTITQVLVFLLLLLLHY